MVYIKKIDMKGFKSYGDIKVSVPLSEGFTCVIGPNGSGKSNMADALLFVLGGLSAKSMRAEVFSDLIYTGKNTKYAEISLYFDNKDREFPMDKNEVVVTRIVFKDGRSIYKVNKKKETRSYVLDLLSEVSVTPDGYNIVHQGEIMNFINMTSLERREIIEEISGIAEFEEKKDRGLRELERTEENLARVDLVIEEVKKQMDRLENEKNDALRYNFLKSEIHKLKSVLLYSKLEKYTKNLEYTENKIVEHKKETEKMSSERNSYAESIERLEKELEELEENLDKKNSEYLEINKKNEDLKRKFSKLEQNIKYEEENLEKNNLETESLKKEKDYLSNEINKINEDLENIEKEKVSLQEKMKDFDEEILTLERKIEEKTDFLKRDYDKLIKELELKKELFYKTKNEINSLDNKKSFLNERLKENGKIYEEKKLEHTKNKSDLENYESHLINLEKSVLKYESEIEKIENRIHGIDVELWKKKEDFLKIRSVLKAKKSFDLERDKPFKEITKSGIKGIYGRVKDLGKVTKEYGIALEVAGGRRLNYIVVDTDDTAQECVKYLKRLKIGRATFIPLNKIETISMRSAERRDGFIDYAINLVEFDEGLRPVFEYVFGNTVIIRDIDLARNFESFRRVTLEGDLIEKTGIITGGFYKPRGGFVDKEEEEKLVSIENKIKELNSEEEILEKKLISFKKELKVSAEDKIGIETKIETLKKIFEEDTAQSEILELENKIHSDEASLKELESKFSAVRKEFSELEELLKDLETKKEPLHSALMEKSGGDLKKLDELKKELKTLESEYQKIDKDYVSKKSTIDVLNPNYSRILDKIKENVEHSKKIELKMDEYRRSLKEVQNDLDNIKENVNAKMEELEEIKNGKVENREKITGARKEKEECEKNIMKLQTKISLLDQKNQDLKNKIEEISEEAEFYEKTEITDDIRALDFRIKRMEQEKESLEPINMMAIEEYETTEERYLTLKTKYEKILKEKEAVLKFIDKVEKRKKEVFMDTFNRIAENFSSIFFELSSGEGNLLLENEMEPFDGGIDIEAKPQGREIKKAAAMSGGEKALTALAFVFAIQRYKTAPFYLFDEIDAHLDDENVRKVAEMIKRVSKDSQFIIITLRDAMMASADRLFGVSMKDEISQIVAVELQDTTKYEGKKFEVVEEA